MSLDSSGGKHGGTWMSHILDGLVGLSCLALAAAFPRLLGSENADFRTALKSAIAFGPILFFVAGVFVRKVRSRRA